jgi:hypothetical protein
MIQEYLNIYYNPDWVYANIKTYFDSDSAEPNWKPKYSKKVTDNYKTI